MYEYKATSYALGVPIATAVFKATNHQEAVDEATRQLGHRKGGKADRSYIAVIGVKAL